MIRTLFNIPVVAMTATLLLFAASPSRASDVISFDATSFFHVVGSPSTSPASSLEAFIAFNDPGVGGQDFTSRMTMVFEGSQIVVGADTATVTETLSPSGADSYDIALSLYPWNFDFKVTGNVAAVTYTQRGLGIHGEWESFATAFVSATPTEVASEAAIPSAVPEPQDYALIGAGLAVVGLTTRRKIRR